MLTEKVKVVKDFKELNVYQRAFESAYLIFELTKKFPKEETYSLTDQIRRSSRSVYANIAEAWRKRRYPASFVSKLSDADGEAAETEAWLETAFKCGYVESKTTYDDLIKEYCYICAQLVKMMNQSELWCSNFKKVESRK